MTDRSGNMADTVLGEVEVNKNQIDVDVALQGMTAGTDANPIVLDLEIAFTDENFNVLEERVVSGIFGDATLDQFTLTQVPEGTANLSVKAEKHLRKRIGANVDENGQGIAEFVGDNQLLAGDLSGSNSVGTQDYFLLSEHWMGNVAESPEAAVADLSGNGVVGTAEYFLLQQNWMAVGDSK